MTAHPPVAAAITDARNKPRDMSPPAWVRTASMPRAPPRFESPLASLLSPSGLYWDVVPPDIPVGLAAALAERYELREVLGRGGMATVYLAYDRKHRRDVALKVLLPGLAAFLGVERFLKAIQVAARLTHPHILALHDSGEAGGFLYYVIPYIDGIMSCRTSTAARCASSWRAGDRRVPTGRWRSRRPWPMRSRTRTGWVCCTATSSRRTFSCRRGTRSWRTSASPRRSVRRAART